MPILVRDITLHLDEPEDKLIERVAGRLKVERAAIRAYAPVRRSLDARPPGEPVFVYAVEVALHQTLAYEKRLVARLHRKDVTMLAGEQAGDPVPGKAPMRHRPVVVGFGPAGMFAAWQLARFGYRPIVVERGQPVRVRHKDIILKFYRQGVFDPESNLLYGEGGAGAYSDGKLYTRVNDPYVKVVLQVLYQHGANPDILIEGKPHVGSDRLPNICTRLRRQIESEGGEIRFGARLDDLTIGDGHISSVRIGEQDLHTDHLLLAIGHSARDTLQMLARRGVRLVAKPFQLGVRIEHPQELVDRWHYGACAADGRLPPVHYNAVARRAAGSNGDLFTFCMCPGGTILPTNEAAGLIVTNGASRASRKGIFANTGLVITIPPDQFNDDPLQGLAFQRKWEALAFEATCGTYQVPAQRAADYLQERGSDGRPQTSYPLGARWADIRNLIPPIVADSLTRGLQMLDRRMPGFAGDQAIITAPETRASAPVRIVRDAQSRESVCVGGLFPIGEGAGYAGGIMSAALDGLKSANQIISRWAPPG